MDNEAKPKDNLPSVHGVLTGLMTVNGVTGIGLTVVGGPTIFLTPEATDIMMTQLDFLLSTFEEDGSTPPDPEEPQARLH